ncbi:hypothetical protein ACHAQJ_007503 [Trichoderma viride]
MVDAAKRMGNGRGVTLCSSSAPAKLLGRSITPPRKHPRGQTDPARLRFRAGIHWPPCHRRRRSIDSAALSHDRRLLCAPVLIRSLLGLLDCVSPLGEHELADPDVFCPCRLSHPTNPGESTRLFPPATGQRILLASLVPYCAYERIQAQASDESLLSTLLPTIGLFGAIHLFVAWAPTTKEGLANYIPDKPQATVDRSLFNRTSLSKISAV